MPSTVNLKAVGINISPNQLELPEGSLVEASNVVIRRDNVLESRRGFKLYGIPFASSTDTLTQLHVYKERILRFFNSTIQFQDGVTNAGDVNFTDFSGSYSPAREGVRTKAVESNGNFYFTSSEGIKKLSVASGSQLSSAAGLITQAGGVKAADLTTSLDIELGSASGFLPQDSAVAYRVVWGIKDANNNLILGTPSQRSEIYNPLDDLIIGDLLNTLGALDDIDQAGSLITDGNYVQTLKLDLTASASQIRSNLIALSAKLDTDIVITEDAIDVSTSQRLTTTTSQVVFTADITSRLSVGDRIVPSSFVNTDFNTREYTITAITVGGTTVDLLVASGGNQGGTDGAPVAETATSTVRRNKYGLITQPSIPSSPATDDELLELQTYLSDINTQLQSELSGIISNPLIVAYIDPLTVTTTANVSLTITIPAQVTSSYFYQVYRSPIAQATGATVLADLTPSDELQLVYEAFPTDQELADRELTFIDVTPDAFRGANLYTNAATGEGILQANDVPPFALDINRFKNYIFFANTRTRFRKTINLLGVTKMISDYGLGTTPTITLMSSTSQSIYYFVVGVKQGVSVVANAASTLNALATPADYFLLSSANNATQYYVWYQNGALPTDPAVSGRTGIKVTVDPADTATQVAEKTRDTIARLVTEFTTSIPSGSTVSILNADFGYSDAASDGPGGQATGFTITTPIPGVGERIQREIQTITTVADVANSLNGTYFNIQSAQDRGLYYVWFKTSSGAVSDPAPAGRTGIRVDIATGATASQVATEIRTKINTDFSDVFTASGSSADVILTNYEFGDVTAASDGSIPTGFGFVVNQDGAIEVLLSNLDSPSRSVDATARSLVRIINKNVTENITAFYLSGSEDVPGKILLESNSLTDTVFYPIANNSNTGSSFNPNLSPELNITAISAATQTVISAAGHNYINGQEVIITNSNSFPIIDGIYEVFDVVAGVSFKINKEVLVAGTDGNVSASTYAEVAENEQKANRIYYSKLQQPESVPITNYIDVGSEDQEIIRIFPLRDSLFVFKEDGLYRISGEVAPFNTALFDSTATLIASDSVAVANNLIYCWTDKGIETVSESGVSTLSRPVDTILLPLASAAYTNFHTATWGVGYESDSSYMVYTVKEPTDTIATICYRYSTLTNSWTTFDKTNTCGIVNPVDDQLYMGAGDINYIEQERKTFTRLDYADRELDLDLTTGNYQNDGLSMQFSSVDGITVGDVLTQVQTVDTYTFNMLLKKLDFDPGLADNNYFSTLEAVGGDNMRTKLIELAQKLDADANVSSTDYYSTIQPYSGVITSISMANPTVVTDTSHNLFTGRKIAIAGSDSSPTINGNYIVTVLNANTFTVDKAVVTPGTTGTWSTLDSDFDDLVACYNKIIQKINGDTGISFSNYTEIDITTLQECVITAVNTGTKYITVNKSLDFIIGPLVVYKAINCQYTYAPQTMGDSLGLKQIYESTLMFENKTFTTASLAFSTDLLPEFQTVEFNGYGSGIFGHDQFGENFFGGNSHSAPFRTYIPRQCMRCRYINVRFNHHVAREKWSVFGCTLTGAVGQSTRAYR